LAPHTDDGEFGCGGTIGRFVDEGKEVFYLAFSAAEDSLPPELPKDTLRWEVKEAVAVLGLPESNLIVLSYPVREFVLHRQAILDDMIRLGSEIKPDIVLLPSPHDTHQDHQAVAQEGFRAFKKVTMLGYELPWNNLSFQTQAFVFLEERHLKKKIDALACYRSQMDRPYASEEFVRSLARTRGTQIGCRYAEVFEAIRWIIG
jgi:LmbE family N-acetylglucosaminyl deacetylase